MSKRKRHVRAHSPSKRSGCDGKHTGKLSRDVAIYQTLAPDETRLVRMHFSGVEDSSIRCELKTFKLSERPEYVALSYCWGKDDPLQEIYVNGAAFLVRSNLFGYLQLMHEERQTCWIFIDALCINQNEVRERNHQVGLMQNIYRSATEVVAWLGTELKFEILDNLRVLEKQGDRLGVSEPRNDLDSWTLNESILLDLLSAPLDRTEDRRIDEKLEEIPYSRLVASAFLHQDYWSRVWILQEVAMARVLIFRFRRLHLGPSQVQDLQSNLPRASGDERPNIIRIQANPGVSISQVESYERSQLQLLSSVERYEATASKILSLRATEQDIFYPVTWHNRHHKTLLRIISEMTWQECTEPYDKVFGVLGLTDCQLRVDYDMSNLELAIRVLAEGIIEYDELNTTYETITEDDRYGSGPDKTPHQRKEKKMKSLARRLTDQHRFCSRLLSALRLEPYNLVVALAIRTVFKLTGVLRKEYLLSHENAILRRFYEDSGVDDKRYSPSFRMAATIKRLETCLAHNISLRSPADKADIRSPDNWMQLFVATFFDVLTRRRAFLKAKVEERIEDFENLLTRLKDLEVAHGVEKWNECLASMESRRVEYVGQVQQISLMDGAAMLILGRQVTESLKALQNWAVLYGSD